MPMDQPITLPGEVVDVMISKERDSVAAQFLSLVERLNADITELRQRAEAAESALRAIQEMADEDLRRGDHPLQTGLFQIEATARAALASRHPA